MTFLSRNLVFTIESNMDDRLTTEPTTPVMLPARIHSQTPKAHVGREAFTLQRVNKLLSVCLAVGHEGILFDVQRQLHNA